ncbi:MAG: 4Fe-4S dicluster domain-containing protein, partial [Myxococcota bacterium]
MTNFGFVINNRTCIGCHACSTACKAENEVPLGVARTWVKYTEVGAYPDVRRNFQVTRCNHCANPPCVRICPVSAMYQREDGIVEFDQDQCIGCKACLQACPYDAIHVDPDSGTAAKCHYCSHRTDLGLEPACVVVCPEHAIIAGDMDDPSSEISQVLAREQVTVRKPEQGTAPKLFYVDGNDFALTPTAVPRSPETFMWSDVVPVSDSESEGPIAQSQGHPAAGPIQYAPGRAAEHMVQVGYTFHHLVPWHWPVPAYLVTKGIAGGLFMLMSLGVLLGLFPADPGMFVVGGFASLVMLGATAALLVYDLERPERFLRILTHPQWDSWLTRGAFLLMGFSLLLGGWWLAETLAWLGVLSPASVVGFRGLALPLGCLLAVGVTVYTAFLFGQAEGRDLWQSTLLPVHLLVQAGVMGGGSMLVLAQLFSLPESLSIVSAAVFVTGLVVDLTAILLGELGMPHATETAAAAAHRMSRGAHRRSFWLGGIVLGHAVPLALMGLAWPMLAAAAAV